MVGQSSADYVVYSMLRLFLSASKKPSPILSYVRILIFSIQMGDENHRSINFPYNLFHFAGGEKTML